MQMKYQSRNARQTNRPANEQQRTRGVWCQNPDKTNTPSRSKKYLLRFMLSFDLISSNQWCNVSSQTCLLDIPVETSLRAMVKRAGPRAQTTEFCSAQSSKTKHRTTSFQTHQIKTFLRNVLSISVKGKQQRFGIGRLRKRFSTTTKLNVCSLRLALSRSNLR